jgi:hypothetical protein
MADIGATLNSIDGRLERMDKRQADIERARVQEQISGVKAGLRLPVIRQAGANPFTAGGDSLPFLQKPDEGRAWYLRHLSIQGLTSGSTPDVVNILRAGFVIWQLTGNQTCQTWGKSDILVRPGESLSYQSVGTFAATGVITITGGVDDWPAEKIGQAVA